MKKRGAGNIEFIMAFLLFISFTAATIYFFNPVNSETSLESSMDYIFNEIARNASVVLDSYSIVNLQEPPSSVTIKIDDISSNKKIRAVDYYGGELGSGRKSDREFCVDIANMGDVKFVNLYFSEDITPSSSIACTSDLNEEQYKISSSLTNGVLSEKRIKYLNETYHLNYNRLKAQLNIPANLEFSFSFVFPNGDRIEGGRKAPLRAEVFSTSKAREVIRENGEVQFGSLTVGVW